MVVAAGPPVHHHKEIRNPGKNHKKNVVLKSTCLVRKELVINCSFESPLASLATKLASISEKYHYFGGIFPVHSNTN